MPAPQLNDKIKTRERPTYTDMIWEQLQDTKTEVRETRKELNQRMDKLEEKVDDFRDKVKVNPCFLPNISSVDLWYIAVTFGVFYSILFK